MAINVRDTKIENSSKVSQIKVKPIPDGSIARDEIGYDGAGAGA